MNPKTGKVLGADERIDAQGFLPRSLDAPGQARAQALLAIFEMGPGVEILRFFEEEDPAYRASRRSTCFVLSIDQDLKRSRND